MRRMQCRWLVAHLCGACLYAQTANPLDWRQRWSNYIDTLHDWRAVGSIAGDTAFNEAFRSYQCPPPEACFPNRFAGNLIRRTTRLTTELGVGGLLGEDLRRRPSEMTGFRRRFIYAVEHAALAQGADGTWRPAYSRYAGTFAGIAVSAAWRGRPLTGQRVMDGYTWAATSYFQDALLTEFEPDLKRAAARFMSNFHPIQARLTRKAHSTAGENPDLVSGECRR